MSSWRYLTMSPGEYTNCMKTEMKMGKDKRTASKICAIHYWNVHHETVNAAHQRMVRRR